MSFVLVDDGTMDTVVQCTRCRQQVRYTYDGPYDVGEAPDLTQDQCAQRYANFVEDCLVDAADGHRCIPEA
jgi:hypothetical protein